MTRKELQLLFDALDRKSTTKKAVIQILQDNVIEEENEFKGRNCIEHQQYVKGIKR